ncbi:hypothetical protein NQ315_000298 [Exocentrus adspersus]|uniref:GRIP domain-containing protein n=1 Tax=Exocentrus adspersus TaxID=1586481 RepID=A0AAV8VQI7_9CUCU|nr:hypothetical protein NQ315_000298 [Exocentrus adspersus]
MFKKLKEKITEEVKSSPQRFAEFTQSVSDKLQNSSTPDDNVFSIAEDDANTSTSSADHGFSSVNLVSPSQERPRRTSTSSMASDVSFLPRYESGSMYHLQSDLDDSISELEDNASTASSQLGHLSKEQIYSAFQKSQMRYHKYRGRYTDLAKHYKEMEREVSKMKSVLVETQDKAIRRVTELKEQCGLEQKAKAHLESALRDELDEKNFKIQALQTKINLLQGGDNTGLLVDVENGGSQAQADLENLTRYLNDARKEIETLNEKMQEMKAHSIVFQSKELEYKNKIQALEKDIANFSEREKENNLKLAQSKMELHNELINKDAEISNLKKDNEALRQKVEAAGSNVKLENLQSQNKKLIEKVESLTVKCNNLESELLKVEKYKLDIEELSKQNAKLEEALSKERVEFEEQISSIREDAKKGLLSLEPKIREKLEKEHLEREELLRQEFIGKIEELSSNNHSLKEMQVQLFQKEDIIKRLSEELAALRNDYDNKVEQYYNLEKNHLELIEDSIGLRNTISNLEKEKSGSNNQEEKITRLEAHISTLQDELSALKTISEKKEKDNVFLSKENLSLQQELSLVTGKLRVLEEKDEAIHLDTSESKLLELKLQKLEEEKQALLNEFEAERRMFNNLLENHQDLKEKEAQVEELKNLLEDTRHEATHLTANLEEERRKNVMLFDKKNNLEQEVTKLQEKLRIFEEKDEALSLEKSECRLLELKLQKLEEENKKLLQSFELERESFTNELDDLKQDLSNFQDQSLTQNEEVLKEKLHDIRRLSEAKEADNIYLSQENLKLQQEREELLEKLKLVREKLENIQMEATESKLLELKVQKLEEEKKALLDEFEMERKMFNKLLENHQEVRDKEEVISHLDEISDKQRKKIVRLKEALDAERQANVALQENTLVLEEDIRKLMERVRILEKKDEALSVDKDECSLLEMKLQKLEAENRNLLDTFEQERKIFNKAYHDHAETETQLKSLVEENLHIKEMIKVGKKQMEELDVCLKNKAEEYQLLKDENADNLNAIDELETTMVNQKEYIQTLLKENEEVKDNNKKLLERLESLSVENDGLKEQARKKEEQVLELFKNVEGLKEKTQKQKDEYVGLLQRTQELETALEKMQVNGAEAVKKEKERQNELTLKIEELQKQLDGKAEEFSKLSKKIMGLERVCEEKEALQKKLAELEVLDESIKTLGAEKQVADKELVRLKTVEDKLKQVESDLKSERNAFKVMEQQCSLIKEEKDNLLAELNSLRTTIQELSSENSKLKPICAKAEETSSELERVRNQNAALENERDNLTKEMSELNLRVSQISSDNKMIVDENQVLMHSNEELKVMLESLENEKSGFDQIKSKLIEENTAISNTLEELQQQLDEVKKENAALAKDKIRVNAAELDISKIQQDFYEIKEKCDSLFIENKNLKSEYQKLEEKCNDFDKVKKVLETQINELENQYTEILHEKQLLHDEIQELKISPVNLQPDLTSKLELEILKEETAGGKLDLEQEVQLLQDKLVQYKSLDLTNKSSIAFYENELQKVKNQNEKLNRKLDETLVTLNHCAELSTSTEVEYLKNVLYNYMLGKESLVLARVIAAVCKFDPQQTENVLQREQQKQTLLGHLGLI